MPRRLRRWVEQRMQPPYPPEFDRGRYVFIHIPKTAGKSVSSLLHERGALHCSYLGFRRMIGPVMDEYLVFAVVREPLSRLTSAFSYLSRGGNQSREDRAFARRWLQERSLTQFIDESLEAPEVRDSLFFRPQTDFLVDEKGRLGKLHLLRFENLDEDFRVIAPRLGVGEALPRLNATPGPPQAVRLGRAQLEKVVRIYHRDYELLGYPSPLSGAAGPSESRPA